MKSFLLSVAVLASAAVAQSSSACAANYIVDTCLSTEKSKLAQCATGDYGCQCQGWKDIITYGEPEASHALPFPFLR